MEKYVCAFRGRRDNYQLPVALAEKNMLDEFITDFYVTKPLQKVFPILPKSWRKKINFRSIDTIPNQKIKCLWGTTVVEHSRHKLGFSPAATFATLDKNFSCSAASRAKATKSNLLLYEPYAWEAFQENYRHEPRKVLFVFHPHLDYETNLLKQDLKKYPFVKYSYLEQTGEHLSKNEQARVKDSWKYADLILCASTFTKKSLIEAGANKSICKVIPYGIDLPILKESIQQPQQSFQVLFVGAGVQRKGLHHLLKAWQQANLPSDSLLTLVCRVIDPGIEALLQQTPKVRLIRGTDWQTITRLYQESSLFAMPSIVEGFGQVYLEALSHGCPVLGTENTCLPDIGEESDGVFLTEVGNIDHLSTRLEYLSCTLFTNPNLRRKARACAEKFTWQRFRSLLCSYL